MEHIDNQPSTANAVESAPTGKSREPKISFAIRKEGKHFALVAEDQVVVVTVQRKSAATLEALLRNCIKYSGRRLFRTALEDALAAPTTPDGEDGKEAKDEQN